MGTNGDGVQVQKKGVPPWLVSLAPRAGARDFHPALAALVSPELNFYFFTVHYFIVCVPIAQQPGQAAVQGRLSLECVSPAISKSYINQHPIE
jgi:hypothetical protein